jgi:hypothetical protein
VDSGERPWDTRVMSLLARHSGRLTERLNAAFAEGLISQDTHMHRLELLLGPGLVDPQQLVGDLNPRRRRTLSGEVLLDGVGRAARELRSLVGLWRRRPLPQAHLLLSLEHEQAERLLVGRHPSCDIVLLDPTVSRRHAQLINRDGAWVLCDLGSTNGTCINGTRVGRSSLRSGDVLQLGRRTIRID